MIVGVEGGRSTEWFDDDSLFGYFADRTDDLTVLRNMLRNLEPGGACLIEIA